MRVDITVTAGAIRDALRQIAVYDGKTRLELEKAINNGVRRMAYRVKTSLPKRTGKLARSTYYRMKTQMLTAEYGVRRPSAHLIEYGTKGYYVAPVRRKALRWFTKSGEKRFSRSRVYIPPRAPRPFMEAAYKAEEARTVDDIRKAVQKK